MTLVPPSSHFSGGTLASPLTIDTPGQVALIVTGGDGTTETIQVFSGATASDYENILNVQNAEPHQVLTVDSAGDFNFSIRRSDARLQVNAPTDAPIFQIDADGSLHGKTGQALTFDL